MPRPIRRGILSAIARGIRQGVSRLIYNFDGIDDSVWIPQVDLVIGDVVAFKYIARTTPYTNFEIFLTENTAFQYALRIDTDNTFTVNAGLYTCTIDGLPVVSNDAALLDGLEHQVVLTVISPTNISLVGAQWNVIGASTLRTLSTPMYDLDIQAVSGNRFYPINDGFGANPVIADTLGGQHGTAMNFNEERWSNV